MTTTKELINIGWLCAGLTAICVGSYMLGGWGGLLLASGVYTIFGLSYDDFMRKHRS